MAETHVFNDPRVLMQAKFQALRPFAASLMIAIPAVLATLFLFENRVQWGQPELVVTGVLLLMLADFVLLTVIDSRGVPVGDLTLPALLSYIGIAMIYVITATLNRFVEDYGYAWLMPPALVGLAVIYGAIFRERQATMKALLALNGLALSVLWALGASDKMALPF